MAKKKTTSNKGAEKVSAIATKPVSNEEDIISEKKTDKKFIILVAICAAIVVGTLGVLTARSIKNLKPKAKAPETTVEQGVMTSEEIERRALYEEHDKLFGVLRDVYWLGKYEEYKTLIPIEAWEALAKENEMTLEDTFSTVEEELSTMEIDGSDVKFYIASLTVMSGAKRDDIATRFSDMYDISLEDMGQICVMDIEMVRISPEGTKTSTDEVYYSFVIRGERYLATENGFVG